MTMASNSVSRFEVSAVDPGPAPIRPTQAGFSGFFNRKGGADSAYIQASIDHGNQAGLYQRYRYFAGLLESQYIARGLIEDLIMMSPERKEGLVRAASHIAGISEVADEERAKTTALSAKIRSENDEWARDMKRAITQGISLQELKERDAATPRVRGSGLVAYIIS